MAEPFISVVAPCYNEAAGLEQFHARVRAVLDELGKPAEIVLVDDGSSDATWEVMTRLAGPAEAPVPADGRRYQRLRRAAVLCGGGVIGPDPTGDRQMRMASRFWRFSGCISPANRYGEGLHF